MNRKQCRSCFLLKGLPVVYRTPAWRNPSVKQGPDPLLSQNMHTSIAGKQRKLTCGGRGGQAGP